MRRAIPVSLLIFALLAMFVACEDPIAPTVIVIEEADPEPIPEPEPEQEPGWTPEVNHVYVMDASDEIVTDYNAVTLGWVYSALLSSVQAQIEIWNRDNVDQRYVVGGGEG